MENLRFDIQLLLEKYSSNDIINCVNHIINNEDELMLELGIKGELKKNRYV